MGLLGYIVRKSAQRATIKTIGRAVTGVIVAKAAADAQRCDAQAQKLNAETEKINTMRNINSFCVYCGGPIANTRAKFCSICGQQIDA